MAVDTRNRRASCLGLALASLLVLPAPDAAIVAADRAQVAVSYAGALTQPVTGGAALAITDDAVTDTALTDQAITAIALRDQAVTTDLDLTDAAITAAAVADTSVTDLAVGDVLLET